MNGSFIRSDQIWATRTSIPPELRLSFGHAVEEQRCAVRAEFDAVAAPASDHWRRHVDRIAIRRACEHLGVLLFSRRRIPPTHSPTKSGQNYVGGTQEIRGRSTMLSPWLLTKIVAQCVVIFGLVFPLFCLAMEDKAKEGEHSVRINGINMWFKIKGKGPVCIFPTPGWGISADLYFSTFGKLEKHFTMVYLETRGSGRSSQPTAESGYSWDEFSNDLEELRAYLGHESVCLIGHAEGGCQVLHYACKHPKRVRALVLINTPAINNSDEHRNDMFELIRKKSQMPAFADLYNRPLRYPSNDQENRDEFLLSRPFYWVDPRKYKDNEKHFAKISISLDVQKNIAKYRRMPLDQTSSLKSIAAPCLILLSDEDFMCSPKIGTPLAAQIRNSQLTIIPQAGHYPWLEQPKTFFEAISKFSERNVK